MHKKWNDKKKPGLPGANRRQRSISKTSRGKEHIADPPPIRLNKFIANSGLCSRRDADDYIARGWISVNGKVVKEMGLKVLPKDDVRFKGERISPEKKVYIIMNKPKDLITTADDPQGRKTVYSLFKPPLDTRIYPVGRLDRMTTGVLLFTNDGQLTKQLTHPKYKKKKIYQVTTDKPITRNDLEAISTGITLDDGLIAADAIHFINPNDKKQVGIEIHSGRNRIIRRIFEFLGYQITKLDRVYFAGLTKKGLTRGQWRYLSDKEISILKRGSYE